MDKIEIFTQHAFFPSEDGTSSDLFDIYMEHPQDDNTILQRACTEMSYYVRFCMEISSFFWSETNQKYQQYRFNDQDILNYNNYKIRLSYSSITIFPDTDLTKIDYPNLIGLVDMLRFKGFSSYRSIFNELLDGTTFLDEQQFSL